MFRSLALGLVLSAGFVTPLLATEGASPTTNTSLTEAVKATKPLLDVRYRYEYKTQDGFALDANANTLRTLITSSEATSSPARSGLANRCPRLREYISSKKASDTPR